MSRWSIRAWLGMAIAVAVISCYGATTEDPMIKQGTRTPIVMVAQGIELHGWLDDSITAREFIKTLPRTIPMSRWGEREFYGKLGGPLHVAGPTQSGFSNGDISYWVPGGSFAIFYDNRHNPDISDLLVFGQVTGGLEQFSRFEDDIELRIELAENSQP